jgi:nucleoside-diphosphate-sugar epimerase
MSTHTAAEASHLIVGCGYLGRRVAAHWVDAGKFVAAITRGNAPVLQKAGILPIVADIMNPSSLRELPDAATILYSVGWDRSSGNTMSEVYLNGLNHFLDTLTACERFIYASSTGVYGQSDGGIVDEGSATEPNEESGKIVLAADRMLLARIPQAIVLRFAGMYGPNRLLRKMPLLQGEQLVGDAGRWLNLIHIDDAASAVQAAESSGLAGQIYNIADDEPTARRDFYELLARLLSAPQARFDHREEPGQSHRRVSNARAKRELKWMPRFPSYREGLPAAVREST